SRRARRGRRRGSCWCWKAIAPLAPMGPLPRLRGRVGEGAPLAHAFADLPPPGALLAHPSPASGGGESKMRAKWFGASVKRKEDPALLTGKGRYVDDIHLPEMLEVAVLRSPHPHAGIRGIDTARALALPGMHAVITYADLPES